MSEAAQQLDPSLPKVGELLAGKYRIERILGQGGMGIVYAANHEILGVRVAIKLLLADIASSQEAVTRFMNEARSAMKIQSENVARVMDVGYLDNGKPFMVVEFLDGDDLAKLLEQRGVLSTQEAIDYTLQALEALAQAHSIGIIHRDLKPANLFLLKRQDKTMQVKVLDFGISKATNPLSAGSGAMTSTKALLGSPYYMSPEQLRSSKSVDARADIWSIGIILYELMTGQPPFLGDNFGELFAAILETDAPSLRAKRPDVPPQLEHVVMRCLQRRPENRYSNVGELASALAPFASARGQRAAHRILDVMPVDGKSPSMAPPAPGATNLMPGAPLPPNAGGFQANPQFQSTPSYGAVPSAPRPGAATGSGVYSAPGLMQQGVQTNNSWTGMQAPVPPPISKAKQGILVAGLFLFTLLVVGVGAFVYKTRASATPPVSSATADPTTTATQAPATATTTTTTAATTTTAVATATDTTQATATKPPDNPQQNTHSNTTSSSTHHTSTTPSASASAKTTATATTGTHPTATATHGGGFDPFGGGAH